MLFLNLAYFSHPTDRMQLEQLYEHRHALTNHIKVHTSMPQKRWACECSPHISKSIKLQLQDINQRILFAVRKSNMASVILCNFSVVCTDK